jgi:thymidylate synthase
MNTLDKQYTELLEDILTNGVTKKDRTGTGTLSVFGREIRHKMSDGFPLLTTKEIKWESMVTELCWFLRGDTNIKWLVQNDCNIWNGDAYKHYVNTSIDAHNKQMEANNPMGMITELVNFRPHSKDKFVELIKTDDKFAERWGNLGPIYGKQWRAWERFDEYEDSFKVDIVEDTDEHIGFTMGSEGMVYERDQIAMLIQDLKNNPDSRRLMVNAWNVGEIDQMVLPPCHYGFQCYTRELTVDERCFIMNKRFKTNSKRSELHDEEQFETEVSQDADALGVPKRALSLLWNQRSVDTFLGLPFNIASYGLLLEIIAKEVNMVPDELIGNLGDTHLYLNHIDQAREQIGSELSDEQVAQILRDSDPDNFNAYVEVKRLKRLSIEGQRYEEVALHRDVERKLEKSLSKIDVPTTTRVPFELPKVKIEDEVKWKEGDCLPYYHPDDFELIDYEYHSAIKAPLSN